MSYKHKRPAANPNYWKVEQRSDGASYMYVDGLAVIVSEAYEDDGCVWTHVSCSRRSRLPSWEDLRRIKDEFIGPDRDAIQLLPRAEKHVNIHNFCLHLWSPRDAGALPDFTQGGESI
jgi:hypothetical protein